MKFKISIAVTCLLVSVFVSATASATPRGIALIYKGTGSCSEEDGDAGRSNSGCSEAAARIARKSGLKPKYVGPEDLNGESTQAQVDAIFKNAKVWIQPGGIAATAYFAMSDRLHQEIIKFVNNGGGYVGWCAGAFIATERMGATRYGGLGIFPGGTGIYGTHTEVRWVDYSIQEITWNGKKRSIYYEGGPYLYGLEELKNVEVIALYDSGFVAAARTTYGKGRVFISGPHPEAPAIWTEEDELKDPDGTDFDLAIEMVKWAGQVSP